MYMPVKTTMSTTSVLDIPAPPPLYQPYWHALLNVLLTTTLTLGVDNAHIPHNTNLVIIPAIDKAFDA